MISVLESILFAVGEDGLTLIDLSNILQLDSEKVLELIDELKNKYEKDEKSGIELNLLGNSYKLTTKEKNKEYIKKLADETSNTLSKSALETLAIIAYNEPITRIQIDEIRGINSAQMVRNLVNKGFVENVGKSDLPGRPLLYKTTDRFLDYFGLSSIKDLPKIELEEVEVLEDDDLFLSRYKEVGDEK